MISQILTNRTSYYSEQENQTKHLYIP